MSNTLDKQYTDLLQTILDYGVEKKDRTGTGTKSIFGYTIRHNMKHGFPLLTTKKMAWKQIVTELLWFLRGDTNIKYLVDNNCHIWDGDAYKNYDKLCIDTKWMEPVKKELNGEVYDMGRKYDQEGFINRIKTDDEFARRWGELGSIYGKQWRGWRTHDGVIQDENGTRIITWNQIDQIANLINDLKTNPDSRRLMVTAWNPADLEASVLPPCHYGFQVYTRELSLEERRKLAKYDSEFVSPMTVESWDSQNIPTRAISLMWNQRSCDVLLGIPFNIASYGLLLTMIADEVNMVPDELIGNLGDTHLYLNHIEQAKEQIGRELTFEEKIQWVMSNTDVELENVHVTEAAAALEKRTREPFPLPTLKIKQHLNDEPSAIVKPQYWHPDDFVIENYQSHPAIKAPLSN
jgi:thymidylate synthase